MELLPLLGLKPSSKSSFQTKLQAFLWNIKDILCPRGWVMIQQALHRPAASFLVLKTSRHKTLVDTWVAEVGENRLSSP